MENQTPDFLQFIHVERVPLALMVILSAWLIIRIATRLIDAASERFSKRRLLLKQTGAVGRFVVFLLAAVFAAGSVVQLSNQALLAVSGSLAVAFGFAFKDLLASFMAGVTLLFDHPFQVGDRITFDGQYGEVSAIGLRSVQFVTPDDNLVTIPNNRFLSEVVSCANAGELHQMCVFHFYIGCSEDFGAAKTVVYDAAVSSRYVFLEKPVQVHVKEGPVGAGGRFAIELTLKAYVFDGRFEAAFGTDVTTRAKEAFRAHSIRTVGELEWARERDATKDGDVLASV